MTDAMIDVETLAEADEDDAWAALAAYCSRPLRSSESNCVPSVDTAELLEALLVELVELVELVLEVELADAMASGGGPPPPPW